MNRSEEEKMNRSERGRRSDEPHRPLENVLAWPQRQPVRELTIGGAARIDAVLARQAHDQRALRRCEEPLAEVRRTCQ